MNLPPDDKDFELAVDKAIDEIFGEAEAETSQKKEVVEDDSLKIPLELEPIENESQKEAEAPSKVIDFPTIDDIIKPELESQKEEIIPQASLNQKDLENLAAALLSLEWDVTLENALAFLSSLEEIKGKAPEELHPILDMLHEVGEWLKNRPEEARPEWFHFLHQGIVSLNLIVLHGKESEPYYNHLKRILLTLKKAHRKEGPEGGLKEAFLRQLILDYQRFSLLEWFFSRSTKTKPWQKVCQNALREIEETIKLLPPEEQPDFTTLKKRVLENIAKKKKSQRGKTLVSPSKTPPFREGYLCLMGEKIYFVPEEQVAYFGPYRTSWDKKIDNLFPLKLLLGFWAYFSFVKLKSKFTGPLAQKEEKELRKLAFPILKRAPSPQVILILWNGQKGGIILAEEAQFFILPHEAILTEREKESLIITDDKEFPVLMVE